MALLLKKTKSNWEHDFSRKSDWNRSKTLTAILSQVHNTALLPCLVLMWKSCIKWNSLKFRIWAFHCLGILNWHHESSLVTISTNFCSWLPAHKQILSPMHIQTSYVSLLTAEDCSNLHNNQSLQNEDSTDWLIQLMLMMFWTLQTSLLRKRETNQ